MGRGLWGCRVRLVTYFLSSNGFRTGSWERPLLVIQEVLSATALPYPQKLPVRGPSLGRDAIGCRGSRGGDRMSAPITGQLRDGGVDEPWINYSRFQGSQRPSPAGS